MLEDTPFPSEAAQSAPCETPSCACGPDCRCGEACVCTPAANCAE